MPLHLARYVHLVFCRGPTSSFIIRGAHLMGPGVQSWEFGSDSSVACICSVGNSIPYAVGVFSSSHMPQGSCGDGDRVCGEGVAVYVLHSFGDALWDAFVADYRQWCVREGQLSSSAILPASFTPQGVLEGHFPVEEQVTRPEGLNPIDASPPESMRGTDEDSIEEAAVEHADEDELESYFRGKLVQGNR